jgi:hypothetical protein
LVDGSSLVEEQGAEWSRELGFGGLKKKRRRRNGRVEAGWSGGEDEKFEGRRGQFEGGWRVH